MVAPGSVYGYSQYGEPNVYGWLSVDYDPYPFVASPREYGHLTVTWNMPVGQYEEIRLVRNLTGFPTHERDGTVLAQGTRDKVESIYEDTDLPPNRFVYYTLWVYAPFGGSFYWRRAGNTAGIPLTDHGYRDRLKQLLPDWYFIQDEALRGKHKQGPLKRFLDIFGEQLDHIRSEADTLYHLRDTNKMSAGLLPLLAHEMNMTLTGDLGAEYTRRMLENAVYIYQHKGTPFGMRALVAAATGWNSGAYWDDVEEKVKIFVYPDRLNLIPNSSFEINLHGWDAKNEWTTLERVQDKALFGDYSMKLTPDHTHADFNGTLGVYAPELLEEWFVAVYGWTRYGTEESPYADEESEFVSNFNNAMLPFRPSPTAPINRYTISAYILSNVSRPANAAVAFFDEDKNLLTWNRSEPTMTTVARNLLPPEASAILTGTGGWSVENGTITRDETDPVEGTSAWLRVSPDSNVGPAVYRELDRPVEGNRTVTLSAWVQVPEDRVSVTFEFRDENEPVALKTIHREASSEAPQRAYATIRVPENTTLTHIAIRPIRQTQGTPEITSAEEALVGAIQFEVGEVSDFEITHVWDDNDPRVWTTAFAPDEARFASVALEIHGTEEEDEHWVDGVLLERADEPRPYFDGGMAPGEWYFWDGDPYQSASYFYQRRWQRLSTLGELLPDHIPTGLDYEAVFGENALSWGQGDLEVREDLPAPPDV